MSIANKVPVNLDNAAIMAFLSMFTAGIFMKNALLMLVFGIMVFFGHILYQMFSNDRKIKKGSNIIVHFKRKDLVFSFDEIASHDVDVQNGFTERCPLELPVHDGHLIVPELNAQAKLASIRTVSKDMHNPHALNIATKERPQFSQIEGEPNLDIRWNSHCQSGTFGAELIAGLPALLNYNFIAYKGMESNLHPYGACYHDLKKTVSTGLIEFYRCRGIKVVIVGGLALDYCVKETVLELLDAGFIVILNIRATREVGASSAITALDAMQAAGVIIAQNAQEIGSMFTNLPNGLTLKDLRT